jgi:phosphotransferase system enzyme I (PtsI)
MVSTLDEVRRVKTQVDEIRAELKKNKVAYDPNMPIGLMIEVPSVAILANDFAKHADFFSIGTNDLTQYTMAADRANDLVSELYQQSNPAVWQLIKMTAQAAENAGIPISVCGEMAGRPCAAAAMLGLGIKNLSMVPSSIPKVKKLLMAKSLQEMKDLANTLLHAHSSNEVEEAFIQFAYDEIDL